MRTDFAARCGFREECHGWMIESNSDPRSLPTGDDENRPQRRPALVEEVTQVGTAPSSAREALEMVRAGLGYLAAADAAQLSAATQAECLRELEQAHSVATAAQASMLSGFAAGQGYAADAEYSAVSWLMHRTGITRGAAVGHSAWAKRVATNPRVVAALAARQVSESYGRLICLWKLATTFGGAGVMHGDLTSECAAAVGAVLDALSAPAGKDDDRTRDQRYHDALQEAMRRLTASNLLPGRAGQPVKIWAHISLADLLRLDGSSALQEEWTALVRARWAAYRAKASETGSDGGAWLEGDAAGAIACDAAMAPIVTGDLDPGVLDDLVRLCVELDRLRQSGEPQPDTTQAWAAIEQAVIGKAVDLLSGPGGLASFLRRRQLGARLGGPSLPLDIGYSETIPAGIRNAVMLRDRHCQWAGGCDQPAGACEVHHTKHKKNGGKTSVKDCILLCPFHHQVVIHRWGWTLVLNPDGTTTAWNKNKTKVLHSHGPPVRPG
jgi:hypothetical protein